MKLSRLLVYIAVTAVSTYLIRVIPLVAIQKKIENRFFDHFILCSICSTGSNDHASSVLCDRKFDRIDNWICNCDDFAYNKKILLQLHVQAVSEHLLH